MVIIMPKRTRPAKVIVTDHARQRWKERGGRGRLSADDVRRRLIGILPVGVEVNDMAVSVPLKYGLAAVCVPDLEGCWVVLTVEPVNCAAITKKGGDHGVKASGIKDIYS